MPSGTADVPCCAWAVTHNITSKGKTDSARRTCTQVMSVSIDMFCRAYPERARRNMFFEAPRGAEGTGHMI